ncbi:MAG TPA: phosphatidylglycerol lysyltransferase domain-containing protein [Solirubrobacteraceae bacterium]|nr:phosphatidylglycerol lysyltransferase domain-containing protein [Solirubrobacteraceae bacterium]
MRKTITDRVLAARAFPARGRDARGLAHCAALGWMLSAAVLILAPDASAHRLAAHTAQRAVHTLAAESAGPTWALVVDLLVLVAAALSILAVRVRASSAGSPATGPAELAHARAIVTAHGEDSLAPFILRPDKAMAFAGGAVAAYRRIGRVAVVSGDPVGPAESLPAALARLRAQEHGARIAVYGASERHLDAYRALGMRAICVGEEAVVDPARFTLEGRSVRKLRQSVQRVAKRGWVIDACDGRDIPPAVEREIESVEAAWRAGQGRILGFAMGLGEYEHGIAPGDLYLLARSPEGQLHAVMRFIAHRGRLSLDTMRRIGETPNGLNEAIVCRALQVAAERGISEVSLNYAGLAHLVRAEPPGGRVTRALLRWGISRLATRFQMERLVRFNEKFSPQWCRRYLVVPSRRALPGAVLRVLQAEGYLPELRWRRPRARSTVVAPPAGRQRATALR